MKHTYLLIRALLFIGAVFAVRAAWAGGCLCNYTPATLLEVIDGDTLVMEAAGGGGYGDPAERDPEKRAEDIRQGYVTTD